MLKVAFSKTSEAVILGEPVQKYCQPSHLPLNLHLHPAKKRGGVLTVGK
jgi:hypothetical protein